jgi:transposase
MVTDDNAGTKPVRRIEVFTGAGRRRSWSAEDKARIVAESVTSGESVCSVARQHGLAPQQLFGWRRQARQPVPSKPAGEVPLFVPAVIEASAPGRSPRPGRRRSRKVDHVSGAIEVEIDGVSLRIGRGADAKTVVAVIRALKAAT